MNSKNAGGWPIKSPTSLLLERLHTPIPELRLVVKRVQNSRRVALADVAFDAD
jgi:hypothetical protein